MTPVDRIALEGRGWHPEGTAMRTRVRLLLCTILAGASPAAALEPRFSPGEQIDFEVDFLHLRTGAGRITVGRPEGRVWPVICQGRSDGLARLLDIREHLVSYWDAQTGLSRGSDLSAFEIGDRHQDSARFDRERGKATVRIQRRGHRTEETLDVPNGVHDLVSAVIWLRVQPLEERDHYEIPVLGGRQLFTLVADVAGRETVSTPAGHFDAVKVQVRTAFRGKFSTRRDTSFWFSANPSHVPVRISADFAIGSLVVTLTGYRPGEELARR
jgi:hypothetical protein